MFENVVLSKDVDEDVVVATLSGEIDIANVADIGAIILEGLPREAIGLVVNLASVSFIDSAGIRMLFDLARQTDTHRQRLGIAIDDDAPVRRLLKITNIQEVVTLAGTVEECTAAMRDAAT